MKLCSPSWLICYYLPIQLWFIHTAYFFTYEQQRRPRDSCRWCFIIWPEYIICKYFCNMTANDCLSIESESMLMGLFFPPSKWFWYHWWIARCTQSEILYLPIKRIVLIIRSWISEYEYTMPSDRASGEYVSVSGHIIRSVYLWIRVSSVHRCFFIHGSANPQ